MNDDPKRIIGDAQLAARQQRISQAARELRGIEKRLAGNKTPEGNRQYATEYKDWLHHWGSEIANAVASVDREVRESRYSARKNSDLNELDEW